MELNTPTDTYTNIPHVNAGLQGLVQLEALSVVMWSAMSDGALCRMLEVSLNIQLHFLHTVGGEPGWIFMQQLAMS